MSDRNQDHLQTLITGTGSGGSIKITMQNPGHGIKKFVLAITKANFAHKYAAEPGYHSTNKKGGKHHILAITRCVANGNKMIKMQTIVGHWIVCHPFVAPSTGKHKNNAS
jgi:hypothetical protein|mmetsp:Transcript_67261/g.112646  ORF Transcript_67261/g.112646 Transcript_67261/m.112646 type:complete len:110 (+) Transcript_67261:96-425(+)